MEKDMSLTNSSSDRKCLLGGWADGSVSKVLTMQAQGPEFNPRTRLEKEKECDMPIIVALGAEPGRPARLAESESQITRDPVSKTR